MKKLLCVVLIILILLLSACSFTTQDKVKLFDEMCLLVDEVKELRNEFEDSVWPEEQENIRAEKNSRIKEKLQQLGLLYDEDNPEIIPIGEEFVQDYLTSHTATELFENYFKVYDNVRNWPSDFDDNTIDDNDLHKRNQEECYCQRFSNFLELILKQIDFETISFDTNMKGQKGYYTQHPEKEPQPFIRDVSGEFNDRSNGNNVYTETRQIEGTVDYYGDFAILNVSGWAYNQGYLGWQNGEFIDIYPSWEKYNNYDLYYKGERVISYANSLNDILESDIKFFNTNGKIYKSELRSFDIDDGSIHKYIQIIEWEEDKE